MNSCIEPLESIFDTNFAGATKNGRNEPEISRKNPTETEREAASLARVAAHAQSHRLYFFLP